jgi:hypothetical protein
MNLFHNNLSKEKTIEYTSPRHIHKSKKRIHRIDIIINDLI